VTRRRRCITIPEETHETFLFLGMEANYGTRSVSRGAEIAGWIAERAPEELVEEAIERFKSPIFRSRK
jgi:hypothetical protein